MKAQLTGALLFLILTFASAQTTEGLRAYYTFDFCQGPILEDEVGGNNGFIYNTPTDLDCRCGVRESALRFDGLNDYVVFDGVFDELFSTRDFSISFYMQPELAIGEQVILSKRKNCDPDNSMVISYNSNNRLFKAVLRENGSKISTVSYRLGEGCWFHVGLVRDANVVTLYINGRAVSENRQPSRVDIENNAEFIISEGSVSPCSSGEIPFTGRLDEMRIYRQALSADDMADLYLAPETIINNDTSIFIGDVVEINTILACSDFYSWEPPIDIDDPKVANPVLSPQESTTYTVSFGQGNDCVAYDSIEITVIDPSKLDCKEIFMPKAFTPNGDGLNDTYGVSNYYVIQELLDFEILDRWGSRVYYSTDPAETWDGTFLGKDLNPGVFLYRLRFRCNGEEQIRVGSLTMIK